MSPYLKIVKSALLFIIMWRNYSKNRAFTASTFIQIRCLYFQKFVALRILLIVKNWFFFQWSILHWGNTFYHLTWGTLRTFFGKNVVCLGYSGNSWWLWAIAHCFDCTWLGGCGGGNKCLRKTTETKMLSLSELYVWF